MPCKIQISTSIPKANIFRFENFWPLLPGFQEVVQHVWETTATKRDISLTLTAKFKHLRQALKHWTRATSNLKVLISNCNMVIFFMDWLEELRPLFSAEFLFRDIIKRHLQRLLLFQQLYWKKRYTVRWTKFGDENTKFFQAMATER